MPADKPWPPETPLAGKTQKGREENPSHHSKLISNSLSSAVSLFIPFPFSPYVILNLSLYWFVCLFLSPLYPFLSLCQLFLSYQCFLMIDFSRSTWLLSLTGTRKCIFQHYLREVFHLEIYWTYAVCKDKNHYNPLCVVCSITALWDTGDT